MDDRYSMDPPHLLILSTILCAAVFFLFRLRRRQRRRSNYPPVSSFTPGLKTMDTNDLVITSEVLKHKVGGAFDTDGERWRAQRTAASFGFSTRSLRTLVLRTVARQIDGRLIPALSKACRSGEVVDLHDALERLSFHNICSLQGWESVALVHELIDECIRSSRGGENAAAGDRRDGFLHDILINLVLAARDTTPSALTWFFWVLTSSCRPEVVEVILDEIASIRSRRSEHMMMSGFFTMDELREMHYLHAALTEALRLYTLVAEREERLEFRPERWLKDGVFHGGKFIYPVVGHGGAPRLCLGKDMAYMKMKAVAASVLERFEVVVVVEEREKDWMSARIRMGEGLIRRSTWVWGWESRSFSSSRMVSTHTSLG